jgi:hypothetical protein
MTEPRPTPRTDLIERRHKTDVYGDELPAAYSLARTLERELAEAKALLVTTEAFADMALRCQQAESALDAARRDAERFAHLRTLPMMTAFGHNPSGAWSVFGEGREPVTADTLDAAVDADMARAALGREKE